MTNYESTSYHVEDRNDESLAFTIIPTKDGAGLDESVLKAWSTQIMPDGQVINVEVLFDFHDVRGLQSFLNDRFGAGRKGVRDATPQEMALPDSMDFYEPVPIPDLQPGDQVTVHIGDETSHWTVGENADTLIATANEAGYDVPPVRRCPHISNGAQCEYAEHDTTYPHSFQILAGAPGWDGYQTGDGAATPPATPSATPVGAGGEQAAESATGAANTAAAPSSAPAEKKRIRRTKLEMAYDRAKEAHNDAPSDETWAAFGAAQKALADKDPGNSRLAESISAFQNPEARPTAEEAARLPLQPPVQFAGEPVNPFTQPPPTQAQAGANYIEQAQHPANQQFVDWANNLPGQHLQDSVIMTTEEAQAATGFPCQQMDQSGTRQCVRPFGHELMTAANPEPKPHMFATDPSTLGQPLQPAPTPMQPQQPAFSVTTPALTGMTDGGAQILSFQTPPTPADPTAFQVQGANLQPPAPAAPFLQPVPNGGQ